MKRILGKDLKVSAVGLGCMGFTHAYGTAMNEKETLAFLPFRYDLRIVIF